MLLESLLESPKLLLESPELLLESLMGLLELTSQNCSSYSAMTKSSLSLDRPRRGAMVTLEQSLELLLESLLELSTPESSPPPPSISG